MTLVSAANDEHGVTSNTIKAKDDYPCGPISQLILRNSEAGPSGRQTCSTIGRIQGGCRFCHRNAEQRAADDCGRRARSRAAPGHMMMLLTGVISRGKSASPSISLNSISMLRLI